ncbi:DUF3560 domain-containing protein [Nocardia noduli]|uniref:DUF3560 domain-containing protein n=1 Tax=Nocardia noduli TaxID=2815722 RepID=UPI001C250067|nr:DUF3560 domain-containing protein [Nocardia noduli]
MSALTISHTAEEGTLLTGTDRGDGTYEIMSAVRETIGHWRWGRSLDGWYVVSSRDRQPKQYYIDYAAEKLREAGYTVEVDIDRSSRATEDAETDRASRQADRVEALRDKASRKDAKADAAEAAHQRAHDRLPPFGEPIKIGHHSERRHRNAIDKAWKAFGRSVEADRDATRAHHRAESATYTTELRNSPRTVANRIDTLEAEQRGDQRTLDGHTRRFLDGRGEVYQTDTTSPATGEYRERVLARMTQREKDIAYWKQVRQSQIDQGQTLGWRREDFTVGDFVRAHGSTWRQITRVNPKSVSVVNFSLSPLMLHTITAKMTGHRWITTDDTVRFHDVTAVMTEDQARQRFPDIFADLDTTVTNLPPRPKRKPGKTKLDYQHGLQAERWSWHLDGIDYDAAWAHPPYWFATPPEPITDPGVVRLRARRRPVARVHGDPVELPVTEFAITGPVRWPEEVHNQVRALVEARTYLPAA